MDDSLKLIVRSFSFIQIARYIGD